MGFIWLPIDRHQSGLLRREKIRVADGIFPILFSLIDVGIKFERFACYNIAWRCNK